MRTERPNATTPDGVTRFGLALLLVVAPAACSSVNGPDDSAMVIEPIQVDHVEVNGTGPAPAQVSAHVTGIIGDACAVLLPIEQSRGNTVVTVTISRRRPVDAICAQLAQIFDRIILLRGGPFPVGTYILRVNDVERAFTVR